MLKAALPLFTVALVMSSAIVVSVHAQAGASSIGGAEYELIKLIFTGKIGLFVGLVCTFCGIWQYIIKENSTYGIVLMVLGALFTMMPTFYTGVRKISCPIMASLGASCGSATP